VVRSSSPITVIAALLTALVLLFAGPALAYPSSTPNAAWPTAKLDAQLKPRFRALIEPRHYGYPRPSWSRYRDFYWRGDGGYQGGYDQGYCDPADPYCQGGAYSGQYSGQTYSNCDSRSGYCAGTGGYSPAWAGGGDPYSLPSGAYYAGGYEGGGREHITIDCRADRPNRLSEALYEVADGGTIHLKGKGPACTGTLQIGKPVIIQGDPPSAFPSEADAGPAVIVAAPGSPCAVIDAGPRGGVEFRDLIIESPEGHRSACIQTFSSAVALVRTTVHYTGESSALYIQGGRLVLNDTEIDSAGYDAAIWSEDATLGMRNVGIATASTGLDVRPGVGQTISLSRVSITSTPGGPNSGGPMSGIIGRRGRAGDCAFKIENSYVGGFRTGMLFEPGLKIEVERSRIDESRMGIAIDGAVLTMHGTAIDATEYGVYAYSGRGDITGGYVTSVPREPFGTDPGATIIARDVSVYAEGCGGWRRREGWRCFGRREAPSWSLRHDHGAFRQWGWSGY
jgi:hypothetical protein